MHGKILLSTAYFPPSEYFGAIKNSGEIIIERFENYIKQTYRNRCRILTSNGIMTLSVPVMKGDLVKIPVKDITIDYSKRWQQVHIRALSSAYNRSPYFQYYSDSIERIILKNHRYLIDLNNDLLQWCLEIIKINRSISYTCVFEPIEGSDYDLRYSISPKIKSSYIEKPHIQVFGGSDFTGGLSILDLIFNTGPEATEYL